MKRIIIIYSIVFSINLLNAQNKLSGKITDQNNIPIAGASIFIPELNKGTFSALDGTYLLSDLPDRSFKITYASLGHTNQVKTVRFQHEDQELNVILNESTIEMEEIVVSGGYNSTQHENAVKIDVLKLNTSNVKNTPNFTEVLTKTPGIDMISKGSGVSKPVIRGLSMNDILILNNGVHFENYQYSSHHPLGIDEFGVENVEIIKGPASLLYGSDAIGGVINFIKEKPAPIDKLSIDYNLQLFSNTLGMTNNIGIKGAKKNFYGGIRFGQKTNSDYLQGGGTFVPNSRFNEISLKTNAGFTNRNGIFKLFYDFNRQNLGLVEDEAIEQLTNRSHKNEIYYQRFNTHLLSSQNKLFLGKFKLEINPSFQNTELIHFGDVGIYEIQMNLSTFNYDVKLHLPSQQSSEYIIGFQGLNQTNKNIHNRETILLPDATTNNYSLLGLVQHTFYKKLNFQTGLRYDYITLKSQSVGSLSQPEIYRESVNKTYGSVNGSLGATYNISEKLLIRANLATAYRTPNLAELTSKGQHELRFEIGDKDLVPEKSYEVDLSGHYHKDNFSSDIAIFRNTINDYIFITPTGETTSSGISIYRYRQANSLLYGGEAGIHLHPKFLKYLHFETTFSSVIGKQKNGDFLPFIPAFKLNFEIRGEKDKLWSIENAYISLNLCNVFSQDNIAPDETPTKSFNLLDFNMGGNIKVKGQSMILNLGVSNMFDTKYIDHLSTLKEVNFYNPGRNISMSLKIPFEISLKDK